MSAISGFCEKCNKFRKRHCDGNRNTCMSILFDTIEALQQENEQLKEQINTAKIGWDTYKTYSEQLEQQTAESNKIIETQRQEIEKLKATLADWKYNAKCDADHIAVLMSDRDEQVERIINKIREERKSQDEKWGEQNHYPLMWFSIIGEEFGEMCHAFNEYSFDQNPNHLEDMQREAIQVAACCIAMIECLEHQAEKGLIP